MTDADSTELRLARAYRDEAEQIKKAAKQDRAAAEYDRGQAARSLAEIQELEKSIAAREQRLTERGIADLDRREKEVKEALAEIKTLTAAYSKDKHAAAIYLSQCAEREKAEAAA